MLEPTAPAPTCRTQPRFGGPLGSGRGSWAPPESKVCRHVFHRTSSGPFEGRPHASRKTLPTPRATARKRTEVIGAEWHGEVARFVEIASQVSAQAVTSSLDAGPGPMARVGRPPRGRPHRMARKGFAFRAASLIAAASGSTQVPLSAGRCTDRLGTQRASKFAATTTAGRAVAERRAAGRITSATSSTGHTPP